MKIAIIGTKGIPNNYGGFEEFAENLAVHLSRRAIDVIVYNPHYYKTSIDNPGIKITCKYCPEKFLGPFATFIYDYLCLRDAIKHADVVLACGYSSLAPALFLKKKHREKIIISMDGLEWKRDKWSKPVKKYIKWAEKFVVRNARHFVTDNLQMQLYYKQKYNLETVYIPYGAVPFSNSDPSVVLKSGLEQGKYFLIISRPEPENNLEMIIEGVLDSGASEKLIIVVDYIRGYGKKIFEKYKHQPQLIFTGTIYDSTILNNLRYHSKLYFHGHSVGGTNPSLLEAMACRCNIAAHDNEFNKAVLDNDAVFFENKTDIKNIISRTRLNTEAIESNFQKIINSYNWDVITNQFINLFNSIG